MRPPGNPLLDVEVLRTLVPPASDPPAASEHGGLPPLFRATKTDRQEAQGRPMGTANRFTQEKLTAPIASYGLSASLPYLGGAGKWSAAITAHRFLLRRLQNRSPM